MLTRERVRRKGGLRREPETKDDVTTNLQCFPSPNPAKYKIASSKSHKPSTLERICAIIGHVRMIKCCALRRCAIFPKPLWRTGLVTLPPLRVLSSSMFCYEVQYSLPSRPVDSLYLRGRSWRVRVNSSSDLSARNKCVFPGCTARTNGDAIFCWEQPRSRRIGNDTGPLHDSGPEWATPAVKISRDVFAEFLPFGKTTLAFELRRSDAVRSWFLSRWRCPLGSCLCAQRGPLGGAREAAVA